LAATKAARARFSSTGKIDSTDTENNAQDEEELERL
jgi:hypothetical protein